MTTVARLSFYNILLHTIPQNEAAALFTPRRTTQREVCMTENIICDVLDIEWSRTGLTLGGNLDAILTDCMEHCL
jgi:hypothetical protein